MRVTDKELVISPTKSVSWDDVEAMRILNDKLMVVLTDGSILELAKLRPGLIDMAFRAFARHVKQNTPERGEG